MNILIKKGLRLLKKIIKAEAEEDYESYNKYKTLYNLIYAKMYMSSTDKILSKAAEI